MLLSQSSNQTDIFWKFYLPRDLLWLSKTVGRVLGYTTVNINTLPDDITCNIAINAGDTTLYLKCYQVSDLWQQLELASELESDLHDTVDWGRKWLVYFNGGKTQISFV